MTFLNGDKFAGEFKNGKPNGEVVFTSRHGANTKGEWRDGVPYRTSGKWVTPDGTKEEGTWNEDGTRCGGTIMWKDGRVYKGDWKLVRGSADWPDGVGKMTYPDGRVEEGLWKDGRFVGAAK
jgi:hypothetical protein